MQYRYILTVNCSIYAISEAEYRAHSFGHFEKCVLFNSRTFTSRLKSAGSEKREVHVVPRDVKSARYPALLGKTQNRPKLDQLKSAGYPALFQATSAGYPTLFG
jgi:hypothetical protein